MPAPPTRAVTVLKGEEVALDHQKFGISAQQMAFVKEFLVDLRPKAAAVRAGYEEKSAAVSASNNFRNEKVQLALKHYMDEFNEDIVISRRWVLEKLKENIENAEAAGRYSDVNKGLELAAKHLGMLQDRIDLTSNGERVSMGTQIMYFAGQPIEF